MNWSLQYLWLIPVLPLMAAGLTALAKQRHRTFAATLVIGSMALALGLSCLAFANALHHSGQGAASPQVFNFPWLQFGNTWLELGWMLDPLTAVMLVMVCFVGLLIFIYSLGYMAHDENFTRFFCFLSLFAAAMLGLVIANSLLLLFVCWELVGLTSYLLIGFWYHKPSAAAAAKKAFIVTRIGDMALLLGMVWLYSQAGTLLFYDAGQGCLEESALANLATHTTSLGLAVSTGIGLLIFCGAIGKSGQVPLHVWLPDAMEGPTPVSALIHAATMVAAGVFLIARAYPLMSAHPPGGALETTALQVVAWVGVITAVFAATIAVAQTDIKRILAYSTVSQLGFMMLGLGVGGVAVGMFHLVTHAFFKALLFLGAGSVIHGCREEQDIRCMGGLRKFMPLTFATYAVGMLALSGFPLLFSGFWSKDEILHAAHGWNISRWPFYLGVIGALLTGFYMTRQVFYVFFGNCRLALGSTTASEQRTVAHAGLPLKEHPRVELPSEPHESPVVMVGPLVVLALCSILLGFIGTPAWQWFQEFLLGGQAKLELHQLWEPGVRLTMTLSTAVVFLGLGLGYALYGRKPMSVFGQTDTLERAWPNVFALLRRKYFADEVYDWTVVRFTKWWASSCDWLDRWVWDGGVQLLTYAITGLSWLNRLVDEYVVNLGFDQACRGVSQTGGLLSLLQNGRAQNYLRVIGVGLIVLMLFLLWGCGAFMNAFPWLTILTLVPLVGALFLLALAAEQKRLARWLALGFSLVSLGLVAVLWAQFQSSSLGLQFEERHAWIPSLGVEYHLGVDGLGLLMVLLSAVVVPMAMLASGKIEDRVPLYFALVLFLQAGLFGTFTALNFFHWFLFWELSLVPAFFLIKLWGGPLRTEAATQFFVYTMVGSVALLLAFLALFWATGTFDFIELAKLGRDGTLTARLSSQLGWRDLTTKRLALVIFAGAFLGFAVKVPLIPFHTWLPTAYAEAPTGTTMLLTGVMSKMGVYGFLRILLPIFPEEMRWVLTPLLWLAVITIVVSAGAAFAQRDLKRVLAYSSINHLGYCLLGIFAVMSSSTMAANPATEKAAALNGVFLQMFNHGLTAATLFWFVGFLEERGKGLRGLNDFGGLRKVAPVLCGLMGIALFSSLGLPGLNGFVGEFLIFKGAFPLATWATALSVLGLLLTAVFILTILQRVFNGPLNEHWAKLPDLTVAERVMVLPAIALMFFLGIYPQAVLGVINSTVVEMVQHLRF